MSPLPQSLNPNKLDTELVWYKQPILIGFALAVNASLVWLMYGLTLKSYVPEPTNTVSLSAVFQSRQQQQLEPEIEQIFEMSQAPQSSSMPPPPQAVNLTALEFDSSVSIPTVNIPIDNKTQNFQPITMTFSPNGKEFGSVMSSSIARAKPVFQVPPQYPAKAKQDLIEGYVTLDLHIDQSGRAQEIKVVKESPSGVFTRSAKRAVIRWRFVAPEETQWQRITIRYELEK